MGSFMAGGFVAATVGLAIAGITLARFIAGQFDDPTSEIEVRQYDEL